MLFPIPTDQAPAPFVSTTVRAFAMHGGDSINPRDESASRMGTLVLVRRTKTDGSTVTDLRVFPVIGSQRALYSVSRGQIVRNRRGEVEHVEVWAKCGLGTGGPEATSVWDCSKPTEEGTAPAKSLSLIGWSKSTWDAHHPVNLPSSDSYSLGAIEALSFDPSTTGWRVPAPADRHYIWHTGDRKLAYEEYGIGEGTQGVFDFQGRARPLRVCPVYGKDGTFTSATINGRFIPNVPVGAALFDPAGNLAGFGYTLGRSTDLDCLAWGGHTGSSVSRPPAKGAPNPWRTFHISAFAVPITLSLTEQESLIKSL